jgi:hypothetical protein
VLGTSGVARSTGARTNDIVPIRSYELQKTLIGFILFGSKIQNLRAENEVFHLKYSLCRPLHSSVRDGRITHPLIFMPLLGILREGL